MNDEIWRDIKGYEGLYQVSNKGRVKSLDRYANNNGTLQFRPERILKQGIEKVGRTARCTVALSKDAKITHKRVHRLVAEAFIPNPQNKPFIDHIDTNATNNMVENLRWATAKENMNNPLTRKRQSESKMGHPAWGPHLSKEQRMENGRIFRERRKALCI